MAIFIRTGANGSYKSAYTAYFTIYEALKAGRVVVTNIEGMQPLDVIAKRFDIEFPSTSKLIRIFSRDKDGQHLWQHFFCWCPIGALIVIDECQDIFSKSVGFRLDKVYAKPLDEFLPLLPNDYESFFYSRYLPADMSALDVSEMDDRGRAEYDEQGRIIYPFSFNEGFMRHRKYNWDIHLLSPDWGQIQSEIRACAEECYFHKGRDAYPWAKRKPYVYKHQKNVSTPTIPKGKDPNLMTPKIPLESFLLYKSTATGDAKNSTGINFIFRNPKILGVMLLGLMSLGVFLYGVSSMVFGSSEKVEEANVSTLNAEPVVSSRSGRSSGSQNDTYVHSSGASHSTADNAPAVSTRVEKLREILGIPDLKNLYYMGNVKKFSEQGFVLFVSLEAVVEGGVYYFDDVFLRMNNVKFVHYDDCMLNLNNGSADVNIFCKPKEQKTVNKAVNPDVNITPFASVF